MKTEYVQECLANSQSAEIELRQALQSVFDINAFVTKFGLMAVVNVDAVFGFFHPIAVITILGKCGVENKITIFFLACVMRVFAVDVADVG